MKKIDYSKVDVRIDAEVAGKPFNHFYVGAPMLPKEKFQAWKDENSNFFFERYGYYPNDGQRLAFVCSDAACAYASGQEPAFNKAAVGIAGVARHLGFLDKGKLVIRVVKPDPNSNVVQTFIDNVSAEQFMMGGA